MKLSIPIVETIQKRQSVRTYEDKPLLTQDRDELLAYMNQLDNPFDVPVHMYIIDQNLQAGGEKLGTYGFIKGAKTFLGVSVPDTQMGPVAGGYVFENLILMATHMVLGTVWLAATFNRERFASAMNIEKDELFLAISPVGYLAEKRRLFDTIIRSSMKSFSRKEWKELFFQTDFHTPLTKEMAFEYAQPLEMVRLASSAANAQPWRICKSQNAFHFYAYYKNGISENEKIIKHVDLGIALSHFHQTSLESGLHGSFEYLSKNDKNLPDNLHYIISWQIK